MSLTFENVSLSYENGQNSAQKNTQRESRKSKRSCWRKTRTGKNQETKEIQESPGHAHVMSSAQRNEYALNNVNLEVESGTSLAIIGPSGCGKSSLLRVAAGLIAPTQGHVFIDGAPLDKPRKQTALMLQNYGLLPWKTVFANAELGLRIQGIPADEREKRTSEALNRMGLGHCAQKYPAQLSGGMQQRVALARALAQNADLLLMDEPMSALDALLRESMQDMLLSLWKEKNYTQILVTHSIEEAVYLGQRILVMVPSYSRLHIQGVNTKAAETAAEAWPTNTSAAEVQTSVASMMDPREMSVQATVAHPGSIASCIENPLMGSPEFRNTQEFFNQCKAVRRALENALWETTGAKAGSIATTKAAATATAASTAVAETTSAASAAKLASTVAAEPAPTTSHAPSKTRSTQ